MIIGYCLGFWYYSKIALHLHTYSYRRHQILSMTFYEKLYYFSIEIVRKIDKIWKEVNKINEMNRDFNVPGQIIFIILSLIDKQCTSHVNIFFVYNSLLHVKSKFAKISKIVALNFQWNRDYMKIDIIIINRKHSTGFCIYLSNGKIFIFFVCIFVFSNLINSLCCRRHKLMIKKNKNVPPARKTFVNFIYSSFLSLKLTMIVLYS